jgi:hypothetical protein
MIKRGTVAGRQWGWLEAARRRRLRTASGAAPVIPSFPDTNLIARFESSDFDASADLTAISQWDDLSGNGEHFTQATGGNQPWVSQSVKLNGHATIRFEYSTVARYLALTNWVNNPATVFTNGIEVFAIYKVDTDPAQNPPNGAGASFKLGNSSGNDSHVPLNNGDLYENLGNASRPNSGNPTTSMASFVVYNVRVAPNATNCNRKIYVASEAVENITGAGIWTRPAGGAGLMIGASFTTSLATRTTLDGNMAALYIFEPGGQEIGNPQRTDLAAYVLAKWGLTMPGTA